MKNTSRKPYIYKVTNLETGQYYIGSQCRGLLIGENYFTSSTNKKFRDGFKNYGEEKYEITIIKSFTDPKECVNAENLMIRDHMLLKDGLCLNKFYCCNNKKIFSTVGTHGWNKGIPWSEETKRKMSIASKGQSPWNKGQSPSEKTRKKMSEAAPNRLSISIGGTVFSSITEASKYYNVSVMAIRYWVKTKKHNTVCVEKCPKI